MTPTFKTQVRWFGRQIRPRLTAQLLSLLLIVLSSLLFLLDPLLIKWLIDEVLPKRNYRLLVVAAAGFCAIYVFRLAFSALAGVVSSRTVQDLVFRVRLSLWEQMNRLSADYHETTPVGEKLYRMEQDVDQVAELGSSLVPYVLQTCLNAIFVVGTMCVLNFRLTCVVVPLLPLFFVFRRYFEDRLRRASESAQQQASRESSFLQEHLASVVQVQLLHRESSQTQEFLERANARVRALNHRSLTEISFATCYMAVISLGAVAILGYGGYQVFIGALTVGGLVAFYSYLARLFYPLQAAVDIYSRLKRLNTSIRRILEIVERVPSVQESPGAVPLPARMKGSVQLNAVSFSYRGGPAILEGLNLQIREAEKIALVGVSGSGKSTIAKLIARLYDVNHGAVHIDGIDVRDIQLESLRTKVSYLPQEAVLFDRTLRENLLFGNPSATVKELTEAIEIAGLMQLLRRLPSGWHTPIGPRGNLLSGGERQRLALARVLLQKPFLILLDESTSALDLASERKILANLAHRFRNETMVFISHRISALRWVDRILVLDRGLIQDQGTHEQLTQRGGLYAHLSSIVASSETLDRLAGCQAALSHPCLPPRNSDQPMEPTEKVRIGPKKPE